MLQNKKISMRSTNFLPAVNHRSPRRDSGYNHHLSAPNAAQQQQSQHAQEQNINIKLENRVFYMEKAVARLINAFESISGRMHKIEEQNNQNQSHIGALSRTIKDINDSKKEFISKQHIITERLVSDINKCSHSLQQQTSFFNKEASDIRDSIQILSSNLQKNFNEGIKAAMQQCNDMNVQNSNSITSLRKITDQKISHLQQLIVDTQKRAQSQNSSILDIINSNQKNQSEFQASFKAFFEKFRDSMHQNLSALQESSQEQISYLDNVLRAEVKTRMKNTENQNKEMDTKIFQVQEIINQNKRDNKRSWEYISKTLEGVTEQQKHQQTANQPLHKIITNLTKQFDEMSNQQLTDIKSIMQLNQDTSEKQFGQIKGLQIQIQQIWSRLSNQQQRETDIHSPTFQSLGSPKFLDANQDRYQIRPQSYRSDMSSTAAFTAIKDHLNKMPGKPEQAEIDRNEFDAYIQDANVTQIAVTSELRQTTPRDLPQKDVEMPKDERQEDERQNVIADAIHLGPKPVIADKEESEKVVKEDAGPDEYDEHDEFEDDYNDDEHEDEEENEIVKEEKAEAEVSEKAKEEEPESPEIIDVDDLLGEDTNIDDKVNEDKKEEIGNSEEVMSMSDKFEASEKSKEVEKEQSDNAKDESVIKEQEDEEEEEINLDDLMDDSDEHTLEKQKK